MGMPDTNRPVTAQEARPQITDEEKYAMGLAFAFAVLSDEKTERKFSMTRYGSPFGNYVYLPDAREAVRKAWEATQPKRESEAPNA
jgi:hypothetical protein